MIEHTPTPWIAAAKYSSVVGVPIVNQTGKRICNTAFAHHIDDDDAKRLAEANAAFIVKAVNSHDALLGALEKLDLLLDFGDDDIKQTWTFEDTTAIQAAFKQARASLEFAHLTQG